MKCFARDKMIIMGKFKQNSSTDTEPKVKIGVLKEETLNYYRRVSQSLDGGFDNEEDKNLFVNNVVSQLNEEAISVAQNQTASRIIEDLITLCDKDQVRCLITAFSQDWYTVCTDRFASHVLQKLLMTLPGYLSKSGESTLRDKDNNKDEKTLEQLLLLLCDFVEEHIEQFVSHMYASHIVRVLLEVVGGVSVEEKLVRSKLSRGQNKEQKEMFKPCDMPEPVKEKLSTLTDNIMSLNNLEGCLTETLSTTVIQALLLVLHRRNPQLCQEHCQKILQVSSLLSDTSAEDTEDSGLPPLVQNVSGSYLIEQLLALSSETVHQEMMTKLFQGKALLFAVDPQANFVLQKVFTTIKDSNQFKVLFKELSHHIEDILAIHHLGVISKVAETCQRLACCQDKFVKHLQKAFHCYKPEERRKSIVPLLSSLSTYEVLYNTDSPKGGKMSESSIEKPAPLKPPLSQVNLHGSVILQHMLRFEDPSPAVDSLLSLDPVQLVQLACNPCGSHIVDTFYKSSSVSGNCKEQMIQRLKGCYLELACSKNGSRALQTIWDCSSLKQKTGLAEELSKHESKLQGDQFGRFMHRNFAIYHFIHRRKDWRELQGAKIKKRKMFEDLLQESRPGPKKHQKEKGSGSTSLRVTDQYEEDSAFDIGDKFTVKTKKLDDKNSGGKWNKASGNRNRPNGKWQQQQQQKSHKQFAKKKRKFRK